ncbi:hypothetical protein BJ170DRAFT_629166 [Xylariales sp. AK1849]|nr:hypothetical protein BJ170DRAFT_629166 [Xylariales sp. AK1849]
MDNPAGSDKGLLDRLNALKSTTVSLNTSSKPVPISTIEPARPTSREDALSERLKSLRNQPEFKSSTETGAGSCRDNEASSAPVITQPPTGSASADTNTDIDTSHQTPSAITPTAVQGNEHVDPVLNADDQTLEELLADLGSDEQWLEEIAAEVAQSKDEEHRRVTALLEELSKASLDDADQAKVVTDFTGDEPGGEMSDDNDNSDGEHMTRETDDVLAQAVDEAEWEKANRPQHQCLPGVPSPLAVDTEKHPSNPQGAASTCPPVASAGSDADSFNLPTVPSELQEQPNLPDPGQDDDFEADIASRMAKLKGLGNSERPLPSAPTSQVDELGLPVAPTFLPEDRPVKGVYKRYGYTDEDEKTWCTVCLEDGAVRCFGCDDDIYCARCWKEMHVGPRAGYEERGHQWEKYVRGKR